MTDTTLRNDEGVGGALGKTGFAWAIFEWARNPYYILIVIFVFAPYFARDIIGADLLASGELDNLKPEEAKQVANAKGQAAIASVTKWAGLAAALSAPILGAALDHGGRRKPILAITLGTIAIMSWLLWFAIPGEEGLPTPVIMLILVVAYVSFTFSEVTHNSMLTAAGSANRLSMISGLALGLGNLAAVLIFAALVALFVLPAMIQWPFQEPQLGIDLNRFEHMRIVGPICAAWLVFFSVPFFLYGKDPGTKGAIWSSAIKGSLPTVLATLRRASDHRQLMKFLLARMFYADGVSALLALGAVYVSLFLDWGFLEITCYAIFGTVFAFAGGIFGGWLDTKIGVKRALMIEIFVMATAFALQLSLTTKTMLFGLYDNFTVWHGLVFQTASDIAYLALIALIAIAATASISSSRAMLVILAPKGRSGEFFGLFAIAGTITVWMGPLLVELGTNATSNQRVGMASIGILFLVGATGLMFVREERSG